MRGEASSKRLGVSGWPPGVDWFLAWPKPIAFLVEALDGGGVCMDAADFADSTVRGPFSPRLAEFRFNRRADSDCSSLTVFRFGASVAPLFRSEPKSGSLSGVPRANF